MVTSNTKHPRLVRMVSGYYYYSYGVIVLVIIVIGFLWIVTLTNY